MWRSAARRARLSHTNAVTGLSHSNPDFLQIHSKVPYPQPLPSYRHSPSLILTTIELCQQLSPVRFFSSSSTDSNTDVEVSTDDNKNVFGDENVNAYGFSIDEMWKDGIDEVNSVLEPDVSDLESRESVQVVNEEASEVDVKQLDSVRSLLKSPGADLNDVSGSLESSLDDMNLDLSDEFVMRVLQTDPITTVNCGGHVVRVQESPTIPKKNLILFFKWAIGGKNQQVFSVTTRSLDALVSLVRFEPRKTLVYSLWDLVKELGEKESGVVTTEILNVLISMLSELGKGMAGYEVFNKFGDFLCETNADSYYFTIEALCRRSIFDRVGLVCDKMLSEEKLPETRKVGNIICYLCKAGMVKEAHSVYLSAKEKERYPPQSSVNFLISSLCDRKKRDADSVHLALEMLEDFYGGGKQKYAIKQFSCVIQGLCRVDDFDGAKALLSKMIDAGPPPGNSVFNTIINALSKSGDMAEAIKMMRIMEARGLKPDVFAYSVIMSGYAKVGEMEEAAKMLVEAKEKHCKLTPVTYHTIIRGYCKLEQFEKAVKLLKEMEDYGVHPNTDEYNKLIQSLCLKAADWGMAEKLLEEMTRKGLHLNGITKSLIRAVKELEEEAMGTKKVSVEA